MKKLILLVALTISSLSWSQRNPFSEGQEEFEFTRFSDEGILLAIDQDAKVACQKNGLCVLTANNSATGGLSVSFNLGEGMNNTNGGTTIYTGGAGNIDNSGIKWGVTVTYSKGYCRTEVLVPRSLYYALNTYMYNLLDDNGGVRKGFTPADESMIIFFTTVMKQAQGNCGK